MSWAFSAVGFSPAVLAAARTELNMPPAEVSKSRVLDVLEAVLGAAPPTSAVQVIASSNADASAGPLSLNIMPLTGFLS